MREFDVEITERPLGVRFAHADRGETVVVHLVLEGRLGDKLGLEPGDILIGVNGTSVLKKTSTEALDLFRTQTIPYSARFRRFDEDDEVDSDDDGDEDSEQTMFIREEAQHIMAGLAVTPYHRKSKVCLFLSLFLCVSVCLFVCLFVRVCAECDRFVYVFEYLFMYAVYVSVCVCMCLYVCVCV